MSRPIYKISSIARPLEPNYPTNLAVLILLPVAAGIVGFSAWEFRDASLMQAAAAGGEGALVAFLAWALGREIDPDRNETAFVGMALAVAAIAIGWSPAVWTLALALMSTRIVNRSVGQPAKASDLVLVLGLAAAAVFRDGIWLMGAIFALAVIFDVMLDRTRVLSLIFAFLGVGLSVFVLVERGGEPMALIEAGLAAVEIEWMITTGIVAAIFALMLLSLPAVESVGDATGAPLDRIRIRAGGLITLVAVFAALAEGQEAVLSTLPIWAVIAGAIQARAIPKATARSRSDT
ncbi:hypothetical protein [Maricaulis sp.]|uniref:hypothetical protein n=1 Tax=Maricaulis sp. TaxID=1486257 RepID=UPI00262CD8A8|nr:hypothetical protein [Maricaulis sp.]